MYKAAGDVPPRSSIAFPSSSPISSAVVHKRLVGDTNRLLILLQGEQNDEDAEEEAQTKYDPI
jgi:hypothetical protein